ncbi:MAG TPA: ProQ/FINO family protein [Roseiarcus sp.]|nr:ProQ/FINO family protein [Roseiarcus sp.]
MALTASARRRLARATRELLAAEFPRLFRASGADKPPLKVGVAADILAAMPEIGALRLALALEDYTQGPTYLRNLAEGAPRLDLNGAPCGLVTRAQAEHAASRMKRFARRTARPEGEPAPPAETRPAVEAAP